MRHEWIQMNLKSLDRWKVKNRGKFWGMTPFTVDWQWREDWVQQLWAQEGCKCNGYMKFIFPFRFKSYARVGSDDFKIGWRYYEDLEAFTWILKCNVVFYVEIIYVIAYFMLWMLILFCWIISFWFLPLILLCIRYKNASTDKFRRCISDLKKTQLIVGVFMGAGRPTNPLIQSNPTHKLPKLIHLPA